VSVAPGDWGAPSDAASWLAAIVATVWLLVLGVRQLGQKPHTPIGASGVTAPTTPRVPVGAAALVASASSWAYFAYYLGGGPRIIDATSYWLQAHQFAAGQLSLTLDGPAGAYLGRFLVAPVPEPASVAQNPALSVIFPPGYALLLAVGARLGVAEFVGPALAAALVLVTYRLTLSWFGSPKVAVLAAGLSACCATLRYHTADTMAHAWCAVLLGGMLWSTRRASDPAHGGTSNGEHLNQRARFASTPTCLETVSHAALAGFCLGWLIATRPVSGLLGGAILVWLSSTSRLGWRWSATAALATLPGVVVLLVHQWLVTGEWFSSSQLHYYAVADGPPGCFGYGFAGHLGCRFEHGDFLGQYQPDGFGVLAALEATGRRLALHARDAANWEPLLVLGLVGLYRARREVGIRTLLAIPVLWFVGYLPFYFDGNYPGGGARLFADVLPVEHTLLALGLCRLGWARAAIPIALLGFAVHGHFDHRHLAVRDGGAPMFDPDFSLAAPTRGGGASRRLLFMDTDHGFNLATAHALARPEEGLVVARYRGDAHDYALWQALGRPPAFRDAFDFTAEAPSAATSERGPTPYQPAPHPYFQAGHLWPALAARGLWLHPATPVSRCGLGKSQPDTWRGLRIHLTGSGATRHEMALAAWAPGASSGAPGGGRSGYRISTHWHDLGALNAPKPDTRKPSTAQAHNSPLTLRVFDAQGPSESAGALKRPADAASRASEPGCRSIHLQTQALPGPLRIEIAFHPVAQDDPDEPDDTPERSTDHDSTARDLELLALEVEALDGTGTED